MSKLRITIAQLNPVVGDLDGNFSRAQKLWAELPSDIDLVVFPELYVTGYFPEDLVLKSSFMKDVGAIVDYYCKLTIGSDAHILLPCPWIDDGLRHNAVHLIGHGKILATRYKHHLPNYGVFDEARVFSPGPLPDPVPFKGHALGVMICEDAWYEDVATHLKQQGADFLICPNASPFEDGKLEKRIEICRSRVQETKLPFLYVNQIGGQDEIVFDGASFVLSEEGEYVLRAGEFIEDVVHTTWMKTENGHWFCEAGELKRHRDRPELLYQALILGLRDYVIKNGFPGVLLGMSGGIDSALSAIIAADALGPDAVHTVMMPSVYTSQDSLDDARACAGAIGVSYNIIPIVRQVEAFESVLAHHFTADTPGIAHENIQSRCRGVTLMALSNATGRMVLSTGNKSEMATGYATLYGDMCGGFNVLKDVYKTDVYAMAEWRNRHKPDHGFGPAEIVIPDRILTKAPTAELRPDQTDQDSLPPYDVLDDILRGLIEEDLDTAAIAARGHNPDTVRRVWRMLDRAEYKRRQATPGVKITPRAFGRERRYPITNAYKG